MGNTGNEIADKLAKHGALLPRPEKGPGPFHTVPHSFVRKIVFQTAMDLWQSNWDHKQKARQTKILHPNIDMKKGKSIARFDREDAGIYIRWATGHAFLRYHNSLINNGETGPMCRLCGQAPESSSHLLFECPALQDQRTHFLGIQDAIDPTTIKPQQLLQFMKVLSEVMELPEEDERDKDPTDDEE